MHAPYKYPYHLSEFWPQITASKMWRDYAKMNPKESATLNDQVNHKINGDSYTTPSDITNTHFGDALLMAIMTMPA